jgi:hypothetical protein
MNAQNALELHRIAQLLEEFEIDNGPNGCNAPFREEAKRLREIACEESPEKYARHKYTPRDETREQGDFRDEPWERR